MKSFREKSDKLPQIFLSISICVFFAVCLLLKTDPFHLIGAAFCHQIPSRSPDFHYPFCYRCGGLFFGIFYGGFFYIVKKRRISPFSISELFFLIAAFLIYLLDILNSSKFRMGSLYQETVQYRLLSAYPLGLFLSQLILGISEKWLTFPCLFRIDNKIIKIILFLIGAFFCWFLIFSRMYLLSIISRILSGFGCLFFLTFLYMILSNCFLELHGKSAQDNPTLLYGFSIAMLQISFFGFLHLKFIHFEQFFS